MIKTIRKAVGDLLRRFGIYGPWERWLCRWRHPQPRMVSFGGYTVPVQLESFSTIRFLTSFEKCEGDLMRFLFRHLQPGDCAWDIGANKGVMSLFLAQHVGASGRVYAFEPEASAFHALDHNFKISGMQNLVPMRCGLGRESGEVT